MLIPPTCPGSKMSPNSSPTTSKKWRKGSTAKQARLEAMQANLPLRLSALTLSSERTDLKSASWLAEGAGEEVPEVLYAKVRLNRSHPAVPALSPRHRPELAPA